MELIRVHAKNDPDTDVPIERISVEKEWGTKLEDD